MTALTRTRPTRRRSWPLALAAAAALLAAPACSSDSDSGSGSGSDSAAPGSAAGAPDLGPGAEKVTEGTGPVDACSLLEPAEVQAIVPGAGAGEEQGTGYCLWEDAGKLNSVAVRIGSAGLVTDGKLPAPEGPDAGYEDGPDGIRFSMGGTVAEFVAGTRACDVQIVTGKDVKAELVTLVGKLKSRVDS